MALSGRKKVSDGTEAVSGVEMVQPAIQAQVVAGNAVSGSKFALGTVGELRDRLVQHCIKTKKPYELYLPQPPQFILDTPLVKLEKGERWLLGTFGDVRAYAQQGEGFFSTESVHKTVIEEMCELVMHDVKEPKVLTVHFAASKAVDAIIAVWCKANNVELKRMYTDPNLNNPPAPTPASMTLPKR